MLLKNARYLGNDWLFRKADIRVDGKTIASIQSHIEPLLGEEVIDCSSYLLYPALADNHVHTPDTLLRGLFAGKSLESWCDDTVQGQLEQRLFDFIDASVGSEEFRILTLHAYLQYLKSGVAFIVETGQADESSSALEACIEEIGLKALVDWYDVLADDPSKGDRILRGIHLPEEEDLDRNSFEDTCRLFAESGRMLMTHCLETDFRRDEVLRKFGMSTVELLNTYGMLGERTILFHCIKTTQQDRELLAESKSLIVHCPTSAPGMDLCDLQDRSARIMLGTDFINHDMWETMRRAYATCLDERAVWAMATNSACPALYQGVIQEGKCADVLFIKDDLGLSPLIQCSGFSNTAYNTLMYTRPELIDSVMIDGKFVIRNGRCTTVDEDSLNASYRRIMHRVFGTDLV